MPLPHSFHYTINRGHKNEYFQPKKKKKQVPKNQSFNTRSYLTSKNSKRSMNTTLPYNNNLNDENSKPKQKQYGSSLVSPSSCTTSTSSTASSTTGHSWSHSPWSTCPSVPSLFTFSSKFSRLWNSHPPWLVTFTSNLWYPLELYTPFPFGSLTPPTSTSLSPSSKCSRLLCWLWFTPSGFWIQGEVKTKGVFRI